MPHLSVLQAALDTPQAPALFFEGRAWTFSQLAALVTPFVSSLGSYSRVALRATNSPETVAVLLALMELQLPLIPLHPRLTDTEVARIVEDAAPSVVLDDTALVSLTPQPQRPSDRDSKAPLAILYTSGTTGMPKGAKLLSRAFLASAVASAANLGWRDNDRWLLCLPLCHIGGLSVLTRSLLARRPVVLVPRFDAGHVLDTIVRANATLLSVVPTMLKALLDADKDNVLSRLRAVLVGGAAVSPALLDACRRQRVPALTTYGLTEACSQVTSQSPSDAAPAGSGRPLQGVELRIVGLDGADSPRGDVGNILLRGPMLMDGYWKQPPLHGAWFDTGDLGSLDPAGNLHVASRRVDLVVTGGENVYPLEVEQTLEGCVGVGRALVFGVPDDTWGQLVAAAIVVDAECNEGALFDELRSKLASHKRPRLVCFVNELPLLPSGKLARHNASARFAVRPWEVNA